MLSHLRSLLVVLALVACAAVPASAQLSTGSIIGVTEDTAGSVMPGVTVALSGDRVIGTQTQVSDSTGNYRFERLLPGTYHLKFSHPGIQRRSSAATSSSAPASRQP